MKMRKILSGVLACTMALSMTSVVGAIDIELPQNSVLDNEISVMAEEMVSTNGLTNAEFNQLVAYLANQESQSIDLTAPIPVTNPEIIALLEKSNSFCQEATSGNSTGPTLLSVELYSTNKLCRGVEKSFTMSSSYHLTPYCSLMSADGKTAEVGNGLKVNMSNLSSFDIAGAVKVNGSHWVTINANSNGYISFTSNSIKNTFESVAIYVHGYPYEGVSFKVTHE